MPRFLLLSALLGIAAGGLATAQTLPGSAPAAPSTGSPAQSSPAINVVPTSPALPPLRLSSAEGVTRVVLDLPAGASYTLSPTFTGLRVDVGGVTASTASSGPTGALSAWTVGTDGGGGVVVTLSTPFPLSLSAGWRAFELPALVGNGRRLVLELGATLIGGADATLQPRVLSVAPAASAPGGPPGLGVTAATPSGPPPTSSPPPAASGAVLTPPRIGSYPGYTRLVLDLPPGASSTLTPGPGGLTVTLRGVSAAAASAQGLSPELSGWRYAPTADGVTVTLSTPYPLGAQSGWRSQTIDPAPGSDRPRLVLDFSPAYANLTPLTPAQRALAPIPPDLARRAALPGAAVASPALPAPVRVVIDAGHGGSDPGAVGAVIEKQTTLAVALRVRDLLQAAGAEVVMTRTTDTELNPVKDTDLKMRGQLGSPPAALFVSIHVNSMDPAAVLRGYGIETWWYGNNAGSQSLAAHLQQQLVALTGNFSRGLQTGRALAVLKNAKVPAALVEIGFTSHPVDGLNLRDENYLDRVALGIAQGIRDTLMDQ